MNIGYLSKPKLNLPLALAKNEFIEMFKNPFSANHMFVFSVCSHRLAEPGGNSRWRQPVVGRSINR
jgi:hypothetical protein